MCGAATITMDSMRSMYRLSARLSSSTRFHSLTMSSFVSLTISASSVSTDGSAKARGADMTYCGRTWRGSGQAHVHAALYEHLLKETGVL